MEQVYLSKRCVRHNRTICRMLALWLILILAISACQPLDTGSNLLVQPTAENNQIIEENGQPTALPTRPPYSPGELVDYIAQTGDTIPALAAHFNTTVSEIRQANPILPAEVTTLPPGLPMKIPIYYEALWGSPFKILPDDLFVNGPAQRGFDAVAFVNSQPGWLKFHQDAAGNELKQGGDLINYVAVNFSISPRLLLAILEYQTGALTQEDPPNPDDPYPLGFQDVMHQGLYNQLLWMANTLNNGYYGWRTGNLKSFDLLDGRLERPDPWQNAATVAIRYYFAKVSQREAYTKVTSSNGLLQTYTKLFGDPWRSSAALIPGSLQQPALNFPFLPGKIWAFTGGPHTGWGDGDPFAALDFAPPATSTGCNPTQEWATAVADGVIVRTAPAIAVLDLDGDGDERTGWVIFYLHLAGDGMVHTGVKVKAGDPLGHPSCEGGEATGTHVHIARKYNGEWIPAGGPLAFNLEGWVVKAGNEAYQGDLVKFSRIVHACTCSDQPSQVQSGGQ
jgi:LasA protease